MDPGHQSRNPEPEFEDIALYLFSPQAEQKILLRSLPPALLSLRTHFTNPLR
jgi:hypothetical protein